MNSNIFLKNFKQANAHLLSDPKLKTHKEYKEKFEDVLLVINDELDGSDKQCGIRILSCHLCSVTCKGQEELDLHFSKHHLD